MNEWISIMSIACISDSVKSSYFSFFSQPSVCHLLALWSRQDMRESLVPVHVCESHRPRKCSSGRSKLLAPGPSIWVSSAWEVFYLPHWDQLEEQEKVQICSEKELDGKSLNKPIPYFCWNRVTGKESPMCLYLGLKEINRLNPLQYQRGQDRNEYIFMGTQLQDAQWPSLSWIWNWIIFFKCIFKGLVIKNVILGRSSAGREVLLRPCSWAGAHGKDALRSAFY